MSLPAETHNAPGGTVYLRWAARITALVVKCSQHLYYLYHMVSACRYVNPSPIVSLTGGK